MLKEVYCVDALCGAGKTRAIVDLIVPELIGMGQNVIIAAPTKIVIAEIETKIRNALSTIPVTAIHTGCDDVGSVKAEIKEAVSSRRNEHPHVVIITHSSLFDRIKLDSYRNYHLIIDETFQVHRPHHAPGARFHNIVSDFVEAVVHDRQYSTLTAIDYPKLIDLASGGRWDKAATRHADLARDIVHPDWDVYVDTVDYAKLVGGKGGGSGIVAHSRLRPSALTGFKSVTICAAHFKQTGLYRLWSQDGIGFIERDDVKSTLDYELHPDTHGITIEYAFEQDYSKEYRDNNDKAVLYAMTDYVRGSWADKHFVWIGNKDIGEFNPFRNMKAVKLPNYPHGLNEYRGYDRVVCLAALNPPTKHIEFLKSLGMSSDDIKADTYLIASYQAACRISIRDPQNTNDKTILVPDLRCAKWLRQFAFPDARLRYLSFDSLPGCQKDKVGRKRIHSSGKEKTAASRRKSKDRVEALEKRLSAYPIHNDDRVAIPAYDQECNDSFLRILHSHNSRMRFQGTLWTNKYAKTPFVLIENLSTKDFITFLGDRAKLEIAHKGDSALICPSLFDPTLSEDTNKGSANVLYANSIWLDFDGGDLNHTEFARLFPVLRIVACNTYSTTEADNRWRAFIPLSMSVDADTYGLLTRHIRLTLEGHGYGKAGQKGFSLTHGLDTSKLHAASMFYLPCMAGDAKASFFADHHNGRHPLDVEQWLAECDLDDEWAPESTESRQHRRGVDQAGVDAAITEWRSSGILPGNGDRGLFILYLELSKAGVRQPDLQRMLEAEAMLASSPKERLRQVGRLFNRR